MIKEKLKISGSKSVAALLTYYCIKGLLTTTFIWMPVLYALILRY